MERAKLTTLLGVGLIFLALNCNNQKENEWVDLFNGKDLEGWTPKITGYPVGENYGNTFRVEDGLLTVSYDKYYRFDNRFGHLFYNEPFSNYVLRVEYRFIGEQVEGGAAWATKNSGVMFHSQAPETMGEQQDFPISLEAQFLGGLGDGNPRPTGSLCTPGTNVTIDGKFVTDHCITSTAKTYEGEQWVTMDIVARANGEIAHVIAGDTIMKYSNPVMGGGAVSHLMDGVMEEGKALTGGYFALQSESHPIQFRKVMIKQLED